MRQLLPISKAILIVLCSLLVQLGCNRSAKEETESSRSPEVTAQSLPIGHESDAIPTYSDSPQRNTKQGVRSVVAPSPFSPTLLGPGHYNGQREAVIYETLPVRMLKVSPDGAFTIVVRQTNEEGSLLQLLETASGKLLREIHEPEGVTCVAVSPDNKTLAYGAGDRSLALQPLPNGEAKRWTQHRLTIGAVDFSQNGNLLATHGHDNQVIIWDLNTGDVLDRVIDSNGQNFASEVKFVTPNQVWTLATDHKLRWYDFANNSLSLSQEIELPGNPWIVAADPEQLLIRSPDQSLKIIATSSGQVLDASNHFRRDEAEPLKPSEFISAVGASPSRDLAVATADGVMRLWPERVAEDEVIGEIGQQASALASDASGQIWIIATAQGDLLVIDRKENNAQRWLVHNEHQKASIAPIFSRDDQSVVALKGSTIVRTDLATGLTQEEMSLPSTGVDISSLASDLQQAVYCGVDTGDVIVIDGETSRSIKASDAAITALVASASGNELVAGDHEGKLIWIDPNETFSPVTVHEHSAPINCVAITEDNRIVASASDDTTVVLWDVASRTSQRILKGHEDTVQALAFSPDGNWLISGDKQGQLILWDVKSGEQAWTARVNTNYLLRRSATQNLQEVVAAGIVALDFRSDQRVLAVGTAAGYLQTFDLVQFRELSTSFMGTPIGHLRFSPEGTSLLVSMTSGDIARRWQAPASPRMLAGHEGRVRFAALDASGKRAVTGGNDEQLKVWDAVSGELVQSMDNGEVITSGALSQDGLRAVTSGFGSGVVFWDLDNMQRLAKRYGHKARVWATEFSPDGQLVATGCDDKTVRIWDFETRDTTVKIPHDGLVHFLSFSPVGNRLLTATKDERGWKFPASMKLWDSSNGTLLMDFQGHRANVTGAAFSLDGKRLTSCGADGQVCHWDVETGKRLMDLNGRDGLSYAHLLPDRELLIMERFPNGIFIDQPGTLKRLSEFHVPTRSICDLKISSQSAQIIAGTQEGRVYIWDLEND